MQRPLEGGESEAFGFGPKAKMNIFVVWNIGCPSTRRKYKLIADIGVQCTTGVGSAVEGGTEQAKRIRPFSRIAMASSSASAGLAELGQTSSGPPQSLLVASKSAGSADSRQNPTRERPFPAGISDDHGFVFRAGTSAPHLGEAPYVADPPGTPNTTSVVMRFRNLGGKHVLCSPWRAKVPSPCSLGWGVFFSSAAQSTLGWVLSQGRTLLQNHVAYAHGSDEHHRNDRRHVCRFGSAYGRCDTIWRYARLWTSHLALRRDASAPCARLDFWVRPASATLVGSACGYPPHWAGGFSRRSPGSAGPPRFGRSGSSCESPPPFRASQHCGSCRDVGVRSRSRAHASSSWVVRAGFLCLPAGRRGRGGCASTVGDTPVLSESHHVGLAPFRHPPLACRRTQAIRGPTPAASLLLCPWGVRPNLGMCSTNFGLVSTEVRLGLHILGLCQAGARLPSSQAPGLCVASAAPRSRTAQIRSPRPGSLKVGSPSPGKHGPTSATSGKHLGRNTSPLGRRAGSRCSAALGGGHASAEEARAVASPPSQQFFFVSPSGHPTRGVALGRAPEGGQRRGVALVAVDRGGVPTARSEMAAGGLGFGRSLPLRWYRVSHSTDHSSAATARLQHNHSNKRLGGREQDRWCARARAWRDAWWRRTIKSLNHAMAGMGCQRLGRGHRAALGRTGSEKCRAREQERGTIADSGLGRARWRSMDSLSHHTSHEERKMPKGRFMLADVQAEGRRIEELRLAGIRELLAGSRRKAPCMR